MLLFIHIPKTAGTTWRSILYRQYPDGGVCPVYDGDGWFYSRKEVRRLPVVRRLSYSAVAGHIGVHLAPLFPAPTPLIMSTIMRDPVERGLSLIRHLQANAPAYRGKTPHQVLDAGNPQFDNQQVRMLCSTSAPQGGLGQDALDAAVNTLEGLGHLGLSEQFAESYALAVERLGWHPIPYQRLNISPVSDGAQAPDDSVRQRLAELNRFDQRLYEHATRLFRQQVEEQVSRDPLEWTARLEHIRELEGKMVDLQAEGAVGRVLEGCLRGWARLRQHDHPAIVQAIWREQVVAEAEARDPRPGLAGKGVEPAGRCGFTLDVAAALKSRGLPSRGEAVEVAIRQTGSRLKYRGGTRIPLYAST